MRSEWTNKIHLGDALTLLKQMPDNLIDCCVTSPPYWALRSYLPKEHEDKKYELGLEKDPDEYIKKLCNIFDEVKRVMKSTGSCWVNIGDTYYTKSGSDFGNDNICKNGRGETVGLKEANKIRGEGLLPSKCLVGIPMRFALEMMNRGWILRNTIIWYKSNCMPSSAKDRFTVDFEYVFFFVKSRKYYFEKQYEPYAEATINDDRFGRQDLKITTIKEGYEDAMAQNPKEVKERIFSKGLGRGRNKRCVWEVTTRGFPEAHFAVYPEELIQTPIQAGCPEQVCKKCGTPREKLYKIESQEETKQDTGNTKYETLEQEASVRQGFNSERKWKPPKIIFTGYSDCGCKEVFEKGVVLDPFLGSGTTAIVALKQGKEFIGLELNQEYKELADKLIKPYLEQKRMGDFL